MADQDNRPAMADERGVAAMRGGGLIEFFKPLMWSAIVGGTVAALGVQLILTLLGIGIGAAVADPVRPIDGDGIGFGAVLWLILSGIISFGIGGWVAGHMSGVVRTGSGAMHGVMAWALAAVLGATVTALAGSPVLGGTAAGAGPAYAAIERTDTGVAGATGAGLTTATGTRTTTMTTQEIEAARRTIAQTSLWTAVAFLLSLIAAGIGGTLGRRSPAEALRREPSPRLGGRGMQPAM